MGSRKNVTLGEGGGQEQETKQASENRQKPGGMVTGAGSRKTAELRRGGGLPRFRAESWEGNWERPGATFQPGVSAAYSGMQSSGVNGLRL